MHTVSEYIVSIYRPRECSIDFIERQWCRNTIAWELYIRDELGCVRAIIL